MRDYVQKRFKVSCSVTGLTVQVAEVIARNLETVNASSVWTMLKATSAKIPELKKRIYYVLDIARYRNLE